MLNHIQFIEALLVFLTKFSKFLPSLLLPKKHCTFCVALDKQVQNALPTSLLVSKKRQHEVLSVNILVGHDYVDMHGNCLQKKILKFQKVLEWQILMKFTLSFPSVVLYQKFSTSLITKFYIIHQYNKQSKHRKKGE